MDTQQAQQIIERLIVVAEGDNVSAQLIADAREALGVLTGASMILYYVGDQLTAKLKVDKGANLKMVDALMARDGLTRVPREAYLKAKAERTQPAGRAEIAIAQEVQA